MEIIQLHLKHFGKFTDYRLDMHAGVNIISGANETGKSTLHAFIRAMLYGLTRNRSKTLDEYQLREPWDNPSYFAGSMKILYGGKIYRIDRNFYRREERVEVVCETDGTTAEDPAAALAYFTGGLSEADFENTVFIRQAQAGADARLGERLRDYLVNMEQTADASLDVSAAQEHLKKRRKKIEQEKNDAQEKIERQIREKTQESEYMNRDLERLLEKRSKESTEIGSAHAFERVGNAGTMSDGGSGAAQAAGADSGSGAVQTAGADGGSGAVQAAGAGVRTEFSQTEGGHPMRKDSDAGSNIREEDDGEPAPGFDEPEDTGGVLLPVAVLLSFAAAALTGVCAYLMTDQKIRYVAAAGAVLIGIVGIALLWRLLHPISKTERIRRRMKREAFLDRHLGFREDPEDPLDREEILRRQLRAQEQIRQAQEEEERKERLREEAQRAGQERALELQELEDREKRGRDVQQVLQQEQENREKRERDAQQEVQEQEKRERDAQLELQEQEDREKREHEAQQIARSQLLDREISLRRERLDELKEELEKLYQKKAGLSEYDEEIRAIALAQNRIRELSGNIYHESGADFAKEVSAILAALTDGRYTRVSLDEKNLVRLNTPDKLLTLDQVSFGTMQQVYFALRLASAGLLSGEARIPIILDEPFAMYDEKRLESALRLLSQSARQVILFSCQTRELDMLTKLGLT